VCDRVSVDALVLVNAMIPLPGETGGDWWQNTGQAAAQGEYLASIGVSVEAAQDEKVLYFHDVPPDVVEAAYRRGEPHQSDTPMTQPSPLDGWPDLPTLAVTGRDDRLFPAAFQRRIARDRLGLEPTEIDGGHLVALSHPGELVEAIKTWPR
jgi:pimeloyl-ACP methyl ester carboxylesterase